VKKIKVAIVGGSGYAGGELLRLLLMHPKVEVELVTSNTFADNFLYMIHPNLRGFTSLKFTIYNHETIAENCEVVFMATPHGVSKDLTPKLLDDGVKVVDISADFRLHNPSDYIQWYGWEHPNPEMLKKAVYGLPELHRNKIEDADLVACPGCMPTATILALSPIVKSGLANLDNIIVDVKIGSSGGGRNPTPANHHTERFGGLRPYRVTGHRHIAEIEQEVSAVAERKVSVGFTPHAVNMARGVLVTSHLWLKNVVRTRDVWNAYRGMYNEEPFIRFVKSKKGLHQLPDPRNIVGTNFCDIGFELDSYVNRLVVFSSIDNIVKGAAGQAVQCFNVMNGLDERTGLNLIGYH
jgi:N-acetyl-gamma-glutamyl-phosphate/LysW-gamma-L-alpha-aminoadipyl-6-phosphate reductase